MTDYSHQSISDIIKDLEVWLNALKEDQESMSTVIEESKGSSCWGVVDEYMGGVFLYALKFFETCEQEITTILSEIQKDEVKNNHIIRLDSLSKTATDLSRRFRHEWHNDEFDKPYGTLEFKRIERYLYSDGCTMALDLIDLNNLAHRLKDFVGAKVQSTENNRSVNVTKEANNMDIPKLNNDVFVVHGRNKEIIDGMFNFLRALDLRPIEWSMARRMTNVATPHTDHIVDNALRNAQAVIVLYTPDDLVMLKKCFQNEEDDVNENLVCGQPRPNVFFESGMAFGIKQNQTIVVEIGKLKLFSDIKGLNVLRLDNTPEKRKELAQRLETAGCNVNYDGDAWLKEGNFLIEENDNGGDVLVIDNKVEVDLSAEEIKILIIMAKHDDYFGADRIAEWVGVNIQRVKYYLEIFAKNEYVYKGLRMGYEPTYRIKHKGREILIKRGIL